MTSIPHSTVPVILLIGASLVGLSTSHGAILTGSFLDSDNNRYDLTSMGDLDWAYWDTTSTNFTGFTNRKSGGTAIANPAAVGGGNLRGSSTDTALDVGFTNGTSPISGNPNNLSGLFNSQLSTAGAGVSINITLPEAGKTYYITVWGSEYGTEDDPGIFTASLTGASDYTYSAFTGGISTPKDVGLYNIAATPDNNNDVLSISYVLPPSIVGPGNSHVLFDAVAVSAIPEPATYALLLGTAVLTGLLYHRRRRFNP